MSLSLELALGIWGAVVSTAIAILQIFKAIREKPQITIDADTIHIPSSESESTHGVLVQVKRGDDLLWEEIDVELAIRNSGYASLQITNIFIETNSYIQQIYPDGLPVILQPRTSVTVRVQPEFFAPVSLKNFGGNKYELIDDELISAGAFDGLGKKHKINKKRLSLLNKKINELPLRRGIYKNKKRGNVVIAFQAKDKAKIIKKC